MAEIGIELNVNRLTQTPSAARSPQGEYDMYFSGWSMNSDPDYQLGINTCANLPTETDGSGGTTQDGYCDPKFDELYTLSTSSSTRQRVRRSSKRCSR